MAKKLSVLLLALPIVVLSAVFVSLFVAAPARDEREDWDTPVLFSEVKPYGEVGLGYLTPEGFTHRRVGWFVTFTKDHILDSSDIKSGLEFAILAKADDEDCSSKIAAVGDLIQTGKTVLITREFKSN